MKGITDTVKKNLTRGVSGLLAAAVLLSGNSMIRNVQGAETPDREIEVYYEEGSGLTEIRVANAWAEFYAEEDLLYLEALEEDAALKDEAERLAAEQAAKEQEEALKDAANQQNPGDSVNIGGGTGSGKQDRVNLESTGDSLGYEDRYMGLMGEEEPIGTGTMTRGPLEAYWEGYEERYEEYEEYVESLWEVTLFAEPLAPIASAYDSRLYSVHLSDYVPGTYDENKPANRIDNVYEPAFAGWKLTAINGEDVSNAGYFYPDNDYIYFNDKPFCDYGTDGSEITSLTFEPLWGRTVYVRDPYNFVDLGNVYYDLETAKINWDTSNRFSYDPTEKNGTLEYVTEGIKTYNGATKQTPVSTLEMACKILAAPITFGEGNVVTGSGGKIAVVNHLTLEADESFYAYSDTFFNAENYSKGKRTNNSDPQVIGKEITKGVLTITGEDNGIKTGEGKTTSAAFYENACIYVKNTRGTGLDKDASGTEITYPNLSMHLQLRASTVLEELNYVGYRESYNVQGNRTTSDHYIQFDMNKHYVLEDSFHTYKRTTESASKGSTTTNWLPASLTVGGDSWLHLRGQRTYIAGGNQYLTVYGSGTATSFYHIHLCDKSAANQQLNNLHLNLQNVVLPGDARRVVGISNNYGFTAEFVGMRITDTTAGSVTPYYTTKISDKKDRIIDEVAIVCDGPETGGRKLSRVYVGGLSTSTTTEIAELTIRNAHVEVRGGTVNNLYGGGSQIGNRVYGNLNFEVNGGHVLNLFGGGAGGFIGKANDSTHENKISIVANGGVVDNLYGGGAGGAISLSTSSGTLNISSYTRKAPVDLPAENPSSAVNPLYAYTSSNAFILAGTSAYSYLTAPYTLRSYVVGEGDGKVEYQNIRYAYAYLEKGTNLSNFGGYYQRSGEFTASDATVYADIYITVEDGATITNDVCGGGKNGAVVGDINITIKGGEIGGSVYGGGEGIQDQYPVDVDKLKVIFIGVDDDRYVSATVEAFNRIFEDPSISTIYKTATGFSSTYATAQHPMLTAYEMQQFGLMAKGSKKLYIKSSAISAFGKIDGSTNVIYNGGTIGGNIFGGSNGVIARITGNTQVTINADFRHNVFGGGNEGEVGGNTTVTVAEGVTVSGEIYGGGNQAAVRGNTNVTIAGTAEQDVYAGGKGVAATQSTEEKLADIGGSTAITVTGTVNGRVFGGNNLKGSIGTSTSVTLAEGCTVAGDVYGGGNLAGNDFAAAVYVNGGTLSGTVYGGGLGKTATVGSTDVVIGGDVPLNVFGGGNEGEVTENTKVTVQAGHTVGGELYGGGNQAAVHGSTSVTINGTVAQDAYAGGKGVAATQTTEEKLADIGESTAITVTGAVNGRVFGGNNLKGSIGTSTSVTLAGGKVGGNVYGGGNQAGNAADEPQFDTVVTISGGTVGASGLENTGHVYGGGLGESATVGNTEVTISGGTVADVYGGGDAGQVMGNTQVTVDADKTVDGSVYGGGNLADVNGTTAVAIAGIVKQDVYGGGNKAGVRGGDAEQDENSTSVTVSGKVNGNVFGGNNVSGEIGVSTSVALAGGTIDGDVYGGGNLAGNIFVTEVTISHGTLTGNVYGGGKEAVTGDTAVSVTGGEILSNVYGGGYAGDAGETSVTITGGEIGTVDGEGNAVNGNVYGGGYAGGTADTTVVIDGADIAGEIYGGGYMGEVDATHVSILNSQTAPDVAYTAVYGGGFGDQATSENTSVAVDGVMTIGKVYGGGNAGACLNNTQVTVKDAEIDNVFGGGLGETATVGSTTVGGTSVTITSGTVKKAVYGGGEKGAVKGAAAVTVNGGTAQYVYGGGKAADAISAGVTMNGGSVTKNLYGGGYEGNVAGKTNPETSEKIGGNTAVNIYGGTIGGNVYGGGYSGTAEQTSVVLDDGGLLSAPGADELITVSGSVFGGGEGIDAYVYQSTNVVIDLDFDFHAEETLADLNEYTSGEVRAVVTPKTGPFSRIHGSVYGGGDLGRVGEGSINQSNNTATVETSATTCVTVKNGWIGDDSIPDSGHVFGGGNGIPGSGRYNVYMGTVFGSTETHIWGGYMQGNVYGGGKQSRLYAGSAETAATVEINQNKTADGGSGKIAIGGSVFGGGDRGSGANVNASVPTTVGKASVNIIGPENGDATIYFLTGGVYGDGNLCLVKGERVINMTDFTTTQKTANGQQMLKTFYSLQRADVVNLNNTDIVLLGAIDLVDETDNTVYSINRIGALNMENGSTIKLDQIVKYVGELTSDVDTERKFIEGGNNGSNGYKHYNGDPVALSEAEIDNYRAGTSVKNAAKNTVCVANGLYLEIIRLDENNRETFGPINGLFTLQLLRAVPGEGGGFVYGDIVNSTADFICETTRSANYVYAENVTEENFQQNTYYVRIMGVGYVKAEEFEENTLYYTKDDKTTAVYMNVVDNVGGIGTHDGFEYYYWYINGSTINYSLDITGYIGDTSTETAKGNVLPEHDAELRYVLYGLEVNQKLEAAVTGNDPAYILVQDANDLTGQEIAIELRLDDKDNTSLGFLKCIEDGTGYRWVIDNGEADIEGYHGIMSGNGLENNTLEKFVVGRKSSVLDTKLLANRLMFVLHKAQTVRTETTGMNVKVYIDLFDAEKNTPFTNGASMLTFNTTLNISRIRPVQSLYNAAERLYGGVSVSQDVFITQKSAMTAEYKTAYLPGAYPFADGANMQWLLNTEAYTYYEDGRGKYITIGPDGYMKTNMEVVKLEDEYDADVGNYDTLFLNKVTGEYYYMYNNLETGNVEKVTFDTVKGGVVAASIFPKGTKITMLDLTDEARPGYYYYICTGKETQIDLMDFFMMGTNSAIRTITEDSDKPTFMRVCDGTSLKQVEERLIFVADFEYAQLEDWTDAEKYKFFYGGFTLQHRYGVNTGDDWDDIMDYVETVESTDSTTYIRKMPGPISYQIHQTEDGMDEPVLTIEQKAVYYDYDSVPLRIELEKSNEWVNTLFEQGEFSVTVELLAPKADGSVTIDGKRYEPCRLPEGAAITYDGVSYGTTADERCIVVPVETAEVHSMSYYNGLYGLAETVGGNEAAFRVKLYSSPDANYFNAIETNLAAQVVYLFENAEEYSLTVSMDNQVLAADGLVTVALDTRTTSTANGKVTMEIYRKNSGQYETARWADVFVNAGSTVAPDTQTVSLTLNNAAEGTYRLAFTYGDKRETVNFIVSNAAASADNGAESGQ